MEARIITKTAIRGDKQSLSHRHNEFESHCARLIIVILCRTKQGCVMRLSARKMKCFSGLYDISTLEVLFNIEISFLLLYSNLYVNAGLFSYNPVYR